MKKRMIMVLVVLGLAMSLLVSGGGVALADRDGITHRHGREGWGNSDEPTSTNDITMLRNKFEPDDVLADGASKITWTTAEKNKEHTVHIMYLDGSGRDVPDKTVAAGEKYELVGGTLPPGEYFAHFTIHNNMEMSLTLQ